MPSALPVDTVRDFLQAFERGVRADRGAGWSTRRGGGLDMLGGSAALVWQQEALHVQRLFRGCTLASATGDALNTRGLAEFGEGPVQATRGQGEVLIARPTAGAGAGTIYAGTRIEVLGVNSVRGVYRVTEDTMVGAAVLAVAVPIEATRTGSGTGAKTSSGLRWGGDVVFDDTIELVALACDPGLDAETAERFVARVTERRLDRRPGYPTSVRQACLDAGATHVVILDANALGDDADFGVTHVHVADASYTTTDELRKACFLALEGVRVAGCDLQVLGMEQQAVSLDLTVTVAGSLADIAPVPFRAAILASVLSEFGARKEFWLWKNSAIGGAAMRTDPTKIRAVDVTSSPSEPAGEFVDTLPRYTLAGTSVSITLEAEQ